MLRPMGRDTAQVAATMRDTWPQSAAVGVVATDAARRLSTFWYSSVTAMQGDVLQSNASLPALKFALWANTSREWNNWAN